MVARHMNDPDGAKVIVGQFGAAYGVRGWIHVKSYTEQPLHIVDYPEWWVNCRGEWRRVVVTEHKAHQHDLVVKLKNCDDRDQARVYTNLMIAVSRQSLPNLPDHEFYWTDLIGMNVLNLQGQILGQIDHLLKTGANDVLVIKGEYPCLLPYTDHVVKSIDLENKILRVDWDLDYFNDEPI